MKKVRIIAKLEVKGEHVVKGIRMEGLRKVGTPDELARKYFHAGIDEIFFVDIVASLYGRNNLSTLVSMTAEDIFIPLTVGGGIRSIEDFRDLLRAGADKISINTQAMKTPQIITEAARIFGSQCVIVSIQAKRQKDGTWEAYTENGRERTGLDAVRWAEKAASLGAGEIFLTSVDRDGTRYGLDHELIEKVTSCVSIPVIVSGGTNSVADMAQAVLRENANAIAIGNLLHFHHETVVSLKEKLQNQGVIVRRQQEHVHS